MKDSLSTEQNNTINKIKEFWSANDQKILTILAIILVTMVSFRAGQTHEKNNSVTKIDVSLNQLATANPAQEKIKTLGETLERKGIDITTDKDNAGKNGSAEQQECFLSGSKNSDKYHQASCRNANNISDKNKVCFSSVEEAEKKGYIPAKCCNR